MGASQVEGEEAGDTPVPHLSLKTVLNLEVQSTVYYREYSCFSHYIKVFLLCHLCCHRFLRRGLVLVTDRQTEEAVRTALWCYCVSAVPITLQKTRKRNKSAICIDCGCETRALWPTSSPCHRLRAHTSAHISGKDKGARSVRRQRAHWPL